MEVLFGILIPFIGTRLDSEEINKNTTQRR